MKQAAVAEKALNSKREWALLHVAFILTKKALFLFYYIKKHSHIARHTEYVTLMERATNIITTKRLDEHVLKWMKLTPEASAAAGVTRDDEFHWIEVVLMASFTHDEIAANMEACLEFHATVSLRMATHLQLTAKNIERTPWLAAGLLSKDTTRVKVVANELVAHLARVRPDACSKFEAAFKADDTLMRELADLADWPRPTLVWRSNGHFATLFRFLAVRFLSAPDSVLDCEGVHAKWKWIEIMRRGISFKCMNAILKVQEYIRAFGGSLDTTTFALA